MKRILTSLIALSLTGCAPLMAASAVADVVSGIQAHGAVVSMDATKALIVAHNAYQGAAAAAVVAVNSGKLNGSQLTGLRVLNNRALELLTTAGSGLSVAQRAADVMTIVTQMTSITGASR